MSRNSQAKEVRKRLNDLANQIATRQQLWRLNPSTLRQQLLNDPSFSNRLYHLSGHDLYEFNKLLNSCGKVVLQKVQQHHSQNLTPTSPEVLNNPNHPLNPASPVATQLNLMVNPTLNPMFMEYINSQAQVLESIGIENEENEQHENEVKQIDENKGNVLQDALTRMDEAGMLSKMNSELNPYYVLGLNPKTTTPEEAQIVALDKMAQQAPEPGQKSHHFEKIAAAASLVLAGKHELSHAVSPTHMPTPSPAKGDH